MENTLKFEIISGLEDKLLNSINLLEIAKDYCSFNSAKADEIVNLSSILDIILEEQRNAIKYLESSLIK